MAITLIQRKKQIDLLYSPKAGRFILVRQVNNLTHTWSWIWPSGY